MSRQSNVCLYDETRRGECGKETLSVVYISAITNLPFNLKKDNLTGVTVVQSWQTTDRKEFLFISKLKTRTNVLQYASMILKG